eukprot:gb/GECG01010616.1/.p1 GENE.gb/GECG01010616.1/~~gb/GECG01010616.1/.p1  ORF type:complete len:426 (+),score=56.36 gb/GECG01010616.1/:1-1278(+)
MEQLGAQYGIDTTLLELHEFPETGRGVAAKQWLPKDTVVLRVPRRCFLEPWTVFRKDTGTLGKVLWENFDSNAWLKDPRVWMVCLLLYHRARSRGNGYPWKAYMDSLPSSFSVPCCFEDEDIEKIPDEDIKRDALDEKEKINEAYKGTRPVLASCSDLGEEDYSYASFAWAWCCAITRECYFNYFKDSMAQNESPLACSRANSSRSPAILVPVLDLFNHHSEKRSDAYFEEGEYRIKTLTQVAPGEEVFIHYGSHQNASLIQHWGFSVTDNPFDTESVRLYETFSRDLMDQFLSEAAIVLERLGLPANGVIVNSSNDMWALRTVLRLLVLWHTAGSRQAFVQKTIGNPALLERLSMGEELSEWRNKEENDFRQLFEKICKGKVEYYNQMLLELENSIDPRQIQNLCSGFFNTKLKMWMQHLIVKS